MAKSYPLHTLPSSSSRATYDPLPRTSLDSTTSDEQQFKDKPLRSTSTPSRIRKHIRAICRPLYLLPILTLLLAYQLLFNNSYANPAPFEINTTDKIFIAANIVDESLILGAWGQNLQELVRVLGKERVFVSVYGGPRHALDKLAGELDCEKSIVAEDDVPLDLSRVPRTLVPSTGQEKVKRIAFLAEVRNMAIKPLKASKIKYDKVLFINDVFFTPSDVPRLLWGTNVLPVDGYDDVEGKGKGLQKAQYKAACATDFINSWKFYDTFATRDTDGFSIGVPLFPWFTGAGSATSRSDVLAGKANVRVKSCWGGMIAFDAKFFQEQPAKARSILQDENEASVLVSERAETNPPPVTFRSWQPEPYWDASECCLIHADILAFPTTPKSQQDTEEEDPHDSGIYMNPFVRVSYSLTTHNWITFTKRFERLFYPLQSLINLVVGMPRHNPRRKESEGEIISDKHWIPNADLNLPNNHGTQNSKRHPTNPKSKRSNELHTNRKPAWWWTTNGKYEEFERTAQRGGYCCARQLLVVKEKVRGEGDTGGMWDKLVDEVPPLGS